MKTIAVLFSVVLGLVCFTSAQANTVSPKTSNNLKQAVFWQTQAEVNYYFGNLKAANVDLANAESFEVNKPTVPLTTRELTQLNENLKTLVMMEKNGEEAIIVMLFIIAVIILFKL